MDKKVVLVTGANRGIGFEIAKQCGRMGFFVILSGRDEKRLGEALSKLNKEKIDCDILVMDVSSFENIKEAVRVFGQKKLKLDVLINNAGISFRSDKSLLNNEAGILEKTLETNSFGQLNVTRWFLPFMNSPGRIIMVSSMGGSMSRPVGGWSPAYCVSKTLLNAITRQLALELTGKNISVNAVNPGWVRTDMGGSSAPLSPEQGAETPVWLAVEAPQKLSGRFFSDKKEIPF